MNKKISVIIPIYNAQETIERCVNSILNQTYSNLEIILINDGSKDKTEEICNNLMKIDNRIKYFYKKNSGVSDTRNYGLNIAKGDYISFIDADDYIEKNMYEVMINKSDDAEIIICDFFEVKNNKKENVNNKMEEKIYYTLEGLITNIKNEEIYRYVNVPWNKLIKSEIIKNEKIIFNSKISLGEDLLFNLQCMKVSKKIKIINKKLYNFTINNVGLGLKKRNINEYMNNSIEFISELSMLLESDISIGNILLNEICSIINRLINEYDKKYAFELLENIKYEQKVYDLNYKVLTKKNYLVNFLLKHKNYKIIVYLYIIKNKLIKWRN